MPVLSMIFIMTVIYVFYIKKKDVYILFSTLLLLLCFTLEQPLEQYFYTRINKNRNNKFLSVFIEKPANYDIFSFEYSCKTINSYSNEYYYIGGNSNYFFLLDKKQDSVMIIPKSECLNIKGTPISIKKTLELFRLHQR